MSDFRELPVPFLKSLSGRMTMAFVVLAMASATLPVVFPRKVQPLVIPVRFEAGFAVTNDFVAPHRGSYFLDLRLRPDPARSASSLAAFLRDESPKLDLSWSFHGRGPQPSTGVLSAGSHVWHSQRDAARHVFGFIAGRGTRHTLVARFGNSIPGYEANQPELVIQPHPGTTINFAARNLALLAVSILFALAALLSGLSWLKYRC